jgi:4'-phosphopantetheinyl transferase
MRVDFPPPAKLEAHAIHLWWIDLDREVGSGLRPEALLSVDERERAARFIFARDASRFRMGRAMLRLGVGWYLECNPREIVFHTGPFGKPFLPGNPGLTFNVAHSEGVGVIAFTGQGEIGVDVEAMHRAIEAMDIASAYFTPREAESIASVAMGDERDRAFLRLWTRKEAVLKATGYGLGLGLDGVDVTADLVELQGGAGNMGMSHWQVRDIAAKEGFAAAIATPPGERPVLQWDVEWQGVVGRLWSRFPGGLPGAAPAIE